MSLVVQGGTIGPLLHLIGPKATSGAAEQAVDEQSRIMELLRTSAGTVPEPPHPGGDPTPGSFTVAKNHRLAVIEAQRAALLDARDNGSFDADVLADALVNLDATQIAIEMRGRAAEVGAAS